MAVFCFLGYNSYMMTSIFKHNLVTLLGGLFLFVLPFVTSRELFYGATNGKFFFVLFFSYIFFAIFVYKLWIKEIQISVRKQYLLAGLLLFGLIAWASSLLGVHQTQSLWSDILRSTGTIFISHIILLTIVWSYLFSKEDWFFLRRALIWSASIFSLLYSLGLQGFGVFGGRFLSVNFSINGLSIGNETFAGAFVFLTIMLTLLEISRGKGGRDTKILYGLLVLQVISPLMLNFNIFRGSFASVFDFFGVARASSAVVWLTLFYFGVTRLLKAYSKRVVTKIFHVITIVLLVVVSASLFIPGTLVREKYTELSTAARLITWDSALLSFESRPLLGYGPENFGYAVQEHFDSHLYLQENIGEIWFDRAHNAVVETLTTKGVIGLLISLLVIGLLVRSVVRASSKGRLSHEERNLLLVLIFGHILQIFTSFDTIMTHVTLAFVVGYILYLERTCEEEKPVAFSSQKVVAGLFGLIILSSFVFVYVPERVRQKSLFRIFVTEDHSARLLLIEKLDTGKITFEPLRTGSSSLVKGVFETITQSTEATRAEDVAELAAYDSLLIKYIEKNPNDYRARMNLVYIRYAETFLGEPKLDEETRSLITDSYKLSPENPLTFVMDALYMVYTGKIDQAETILVDSQSVFPGVTFIDNILVYVRAQKKTFPSISFLRLENI